LHYTVCSQDAGIALLVQCLVYGLDNPKLESWQG